MRTAVVALSVLVCSLVIGAEASNSQTVGEVKQWHFRSAKGGITVKLSAPPQASDGRTVLSLEPDDGTIPTVAKEANLLGQALDQMPALGYDPRKLEMISTWLQNTEYREGVERSLTQSGKWKSCVGRKYCHEAEVAANEYLASVNAFKPFDNVLRAHGLMRRSVRVDDMAVSAGSAHISCSGLLVIALAENR